MRGAALTALDACERYFPAFQFVVWAGKPAREALDAAMFETQGRRRPAVSAVIPGAPPISGLPEIGV